ncbi:MAG: hypothetical protein P8J45_06805 [Phycisphaerales bacterium]|jgi:hypothetical protein|nr:hypothetical protein [Phycisphaerales bacterium]
MNRHEHDDDTRSTSTLRQRSILLIDGICTKIGASRRQFGVFSLLLVVACTFWARPAGMLIWHRLRIVTGMPRMAIANEDPDVLASMDIPEPDLIDAGREVRLDQNLLRDPFLIGSTDGEQGSGTASGANDAELDLKARMQALTERASRIRLSGTSRGLGTAVLDGRVTVLGAESKTQDIDYRLIEVRSGSVVIDVSMPGEEQWVRFLLDRERAFPVRDD